MPSKKLALKNARACLVLPECQDFAAQNTKITKAIKHKKKKIQIKPSKHQICQGLPRQARMLYDDHHIWSYDFMMIITLQYNHHHMMIQLHNIARACLIMPGLCFMMISISFQIQKKKTYKYQLYYLNFSGLASSCQDSAARTYLILSSIIWLFILPPW